MNNLKACLICKSENRKIAFMDFGTPVYRCLECGNVYSGHEAPDDYDGYFGFKEIQSADAYWWNEAHSAMYKEFCDKYLKGRSGKLLDVGCGLGYFVKKAGEYPGWEARGYEISEPAVQFARSNLNLKNVEAGRVEESDFPQDFFDIITLWDVIEHLSNPDIMLAYLHGIIKPGGMLFMHTPNVQIQLPKARAKKFFFGMKESVHYLEAKDHMNIFSQKTISRLLKRNGFGHIKFIHLAPIQSVSGSSSAVLRAIKNLWNGWAKIIGLISFGKINIDNLFVISKKI